VIQNLGQSPPLRGLHAKTLSFYRCRCSHPFYHCVEVKDRFAVSSPLQMYYTMSQPGAHGWIPPLIPLHWTLVQNIKRDPFEQAVGVQQKATMSFRKRIGCSGNCVSIRLEHVAVGQQLRLEWFETLKAFPPMQPSAGYQPHAGLDRIKSNAGHPSE